MGRPGVWQLVLLLVIIILLFGARRLPDLARSMGQSLKIFKSEVKDLGEDERDAASREGRASAGDTTTDPSRAHVEGGATFPTEATSEPRITRPDGERDPRA
jgi:sec-independent protein translocase protein TatA